MFSSNFPTNSARVHVALGVQDLDRSVAFYRTLLGQEPSKVRPGYAKFELAAPGLNLALNQVAERTAPGNSVAHFGIEVPSLNFVQQMVERLSRAGVETLVQQNVTCCYAVQDKVWARDPDGNKWEVFVVLEHDPSQKQEGADVCCATSTAGSPTIAGPRRSATAEPCC